MVEIPEERWLALDRTIREALADSGWARSEYGRRHNMTSFEASNGELTLTVAHNVLESTIAIVIHTPDGVMDLMVDYDESPDTLLQTLDQWRDRVDVANFRDFIDGLAATGLETFALTDDTWVRVRPRSA